MKRPLLFFLILFLAIVLRFSRLGTFPPGFTWDEAAIGYNAYGILTVHRDEWLSRFPLSFRSFGDYKSPLAIYITAFSELFLGPTQTAVRLPAAAAGVGIVLASYYLVRELLSRERMAEEGGLVAMFLTAISPWALHFSSIAFESGMSACLAAWGTVFFLRGMRSSRVFFFLISGVLYSLSLYAYHSAKVVVPLTIVLLLMWLRQSLRDQKKKIFLFFFACIIVSLPLLYGSVFGKASDRFFGSTAILDSQRHLRPLPEVAQILAGHFFSHFTVSYLFFGGEQTYRQSNMLDGVLSPLEGLLIVAALWFAWRQKKLRPFIFFVVGLLVVSVFPATLGNDVPHANRAFLGVPWFQVLAAIGAVGLWRLVCERDLGQVRKTGVYVSFFGAAFLGLFIHVRNDMQVYASSQALRDLQYGYADVIAYVRSQESTVRKIYFTNHYGQAYIYLLFFKHMNPIDYRGGGLANYVITDHPFTDAAGQSNVLIVGTEDEIPPTVGREKEFKYPDGKVAFRVVRQ